MDTSEEKDDEIEVIMVDGRFFSASLNVSKHFIKYVVGKKGVTKKTIERDTKTEIVIPKPEKTEDIVIYGNSASDVKMAWRKINMIVKSSKLKQRPTHFLSVPMNGTDIMKSFENFKEGVLRDCPDEGIEESLFIKPTKLHITSGVMCLMDDEEKELVPKLLKEAKETIIMPIIKDHLPLRLRLKGLSHMNNNPSSVHVLYGRVQEEGPAPTGLMQNLADALVGHFIQAGFMKREFDRDSVNLHVTLLNSRYRNSSATADHGDSSRKKSWIKRKKFDGSRILEKYADYDFGIMEVSEIHLSEMGSMSPDGYYQATCIVSCKNND